MRNILALVICIGFFWACSDTPEVVSCSTPLETDKQTIENYMDNNNLNGQVTPEGVYYVIDIPGSTDKPNADSQVTVSYRGYLLDGTEFDSNANFTVPLWQVIEGWTIGVPQFGKEGSGTILIPSTLAYDCTAREGIPENSILAFDITLIDFE